MSLLQHPVEIDGMFRPGTRGAHPSIEVLLRSLGLDAHSVMFHAHSLKSVLKSRQCILPRGDDAFSTVQLPLLDKELLL
jgi:hypothetical protein